MLGGLPLSAAGLLCAAGLVYATFALPRPGRVAGRWLALGLACVVGLKLIAATTAPPLGIKATYWARATPTGVPERSIDYPWLLDATRLDQTLDLHAEDFAVHFFNDAARFNFGPDVQPARDQLPFSVRWQAWLLAPSDGERRFVTESTGPAHVTLDGVVLTSADARLFVSAGLHDLQVDYQRPAARVPLLRLRWERLPGGSLEPVGGADTHWQPNAAATGLSSFIWLVGDLGLVALCSSWVLLGLVRARRGGLARAALGALPLLFLVHGMLLHAPLDGRATILSGLDDWLVYESSARDILLNGPLMTNGQPHAPPFYGQPVYLYVLALAHRLTGESLFGPLALQFAALGTVLASTAVLARRAFGSRLDGLVGLAFFSLFLQLEPEHFKIARQLFNENLYMPLVMASLVVLVGQARQSRPPVWWRAVLIGCLLGLTAICRSQFLLFVPFGLLILLVGWWKNRRTAAQAALAMLAGLLLAIAPVTARNWMVSGQLVPISSSGGASLLEFHRPPPGLIDQTALQNNAVYEALHLDMQTRTVLAFVSADPRGYLATLLSPAAHSVGLQGRNDPGVYWPLFITTLLYVAAFALKRTRRLQVWPIHAFVGTHLVVLMLFEADTYGYRLVMPMYAPLAVVAAQVPLAGFRYALHMVRTLMSAHRDPQRAMRFAQLGWGMVVLGALAWQAKGLADLWPNRDAALHGLGGPAAQAAAAADRVGADAIYVASIDGTPRRFGAGSLPGLRYPWFKWFDPSRSVPLPPPSSTAVYVLSELQGHSLPSDLVGCLGPPDTDALRVVSGAQARQECVGDWPPRALVDFDGVARFDALRVPSTGEVGEALETRLVWQPLVAHPEAHQVSLHLDDPEAGDDMLWGNGTLDLYPARQWEPGEALLSRLPVSTDPSAIPHSYRLTLGLGPARPNATQASALWQGVPAQRVPVATVTLTPGSSGSKVQTLPGDMRLIEGPPLIGGGLELMAVRPLPAEATAGGRLRIGLLWRATHDAPVAAQCVLRLVRENGEVAQESTVPLFGGRLAQSTVRAEDVLRDEHVLFAPARGSGEPLWLNVTLLDAGGALLAESTRLGTVKLTGRTHVFASGAEPAPEAAFGEAMQLLSAKVEPALARANEKIAVQLRWRSAAEMSQAYKVFVHVLDPTGEHVVAQRDSEPQGGRAPTSSWVVGEVLDDEYPISLPNSVSPGDYPIEVGVYDGRSGQRLLLANGDNRLVLSTHLRVR